jgi:hypothetical protein
MPEDPGPKVVRCEACGKVFPTAAVETPNGIAHVPIAPVTVEVLRKKASIVGRDGRPIATGAAIPNLNDRFEKVTVVVPHNLVCPASHPEGVAPLLTCLVPREPEPEGDVVEGEFGEPEEVSN